LCYYSILALALTNVEYQNTVKIVDLTCTIVLLSVFNNSILTGMKILGNNIKMTENNWRVWLIVKLKARWERGWSPASNDNYIAGGFSVHLQFSIL
jgi:hypothetical protein